MRLATFDDGTRIGLCRVDDEVTLHDLTAVTGKHTLLDVIEDWARWAPLLKSAADLPIVSAPRLLAPIPRPRRDLFAVGKNYRDHVREFGRSGYDRPDRSEDLPTHPVIFSKATTSVTGPYDTINPHSGVTSELDYEAELAVIIGRGGRAVRREQALEHVWGYTVINDITARDLQRNHSQWLLGKSLDTFAPMGPWAVTADEVGALDKLVVSSAVNGEPRQEASVADLIFDVPELIRTISAGISLIPGDIIATGTPAGVGIGFDPPRLLQPGDIVESSVSGIGTLRNVIGTTA